MVHHDDVRRARLLLTDAGFAAELRPEQPRA
jgi:hypothetical protein